ncbi:TetR/AcrR family transcriptional regulator [Aeromicrobium sp.]|uniref:TetR/AcrR family transcriptional regulator n=1 Tax=Aeromicrobium sp. TaxID=1871063 RepID=UPI0030BB493D
MPTERQRNTDGRIARGERTRDAIVEAHAELLRAGVLKPTGKIIAEKAGISLRTLWLNFKDLEALLEATTGYWLEADAAQWDPIAQSLPLQQRIDIFCRQRARRMEHLAPAAKSALLGEPFSAALAASRAKHVERLQGDLLAVFPDRLEDGTGPHRTMALALFVAASVTTWTVLRDDFSLGISDATAVMRDTFTALLEPRT